MDLKSTAYVPCSLLYIAETTEGCSCQDQLLSPEYQTFESHKTKPDWIKHIHSMQDTNEKLNSA